ncbi:MAG: class I SAM-dependent methyltransferase, partial [Gemmatimonadetes bacterium]|nr:class I SAM-dependent methyltransferase [Gemmatimonadota bacterium]
MSDVQFEPHEVVWTREKSGRFWASKAAFSDASIPYFSQEVGSSLLRFVESNGVPLKGRVIDFGCGLGHLIERLLEKQIPAQGIDFSEESVEAVRKRLGSNPLFRGAEVVHGIPTHLPAGGFDTVLLIETIEHLLDGDLEATADELFRITAPGGHVIVSTPHDEFLPGSETMCPDCGGRFHKMQHVRSWNPRTLSAFMGQHGFREVFSRPVYLSDTWARTRLL